MKNLLKYMFVGLLGCTLVTSCSDDTLETSPTGSTSGDQLFATANAALVPLNGIYRSMYTAGWSTSENTHQCFGISAYNIMADVMGEDMIMSNMGSGWFWYDALYNVKSRYTSSAWRSYDLWNAYYTWISNANYIINAEKNMEGDEADVNYVIGQAYAIRGYSYFMLAQNFARTYKGHESDPCCPIYTTPTQAGTQGNPRSTVQEVYDQIVSDMTRAAELLQNAGSRESMSHIDYAVLMGLRARVALVMEDWTTARDAAKAAINSTDAQVQAVEDFAGLNSVDDGNVMWGAQIISDQVGQYASFFAHMDACDESGNGVYGASARKQINRELYDMMATNDTRRAWWDPENKNNEDEDGNQLGYQQEKFKFSDRSTWMGDYIWMRVEEMYLIAAEAECRLGEETAAIADLTAVMSQRVEGYTTHKTGTALGKLTSDTTGSLLEEIINQRRIELWGEVGRIWDIRRLKQGFRRTRAQGWPSSALLSNRPTDDPECYMWVLTIPQSEFDGNVNMNLATDQNPTGDYAE